MSTRYLPHVTNKVGLRQLIFYYLQCQWTAWRNQRSGAPSRHPAQGGRLGPPWTSLHTKSANCTNVRVWFYRHRRRRSLSMRAGCLRPVPASGGRACLDILSHGRAPCASSRYGAKDLRKLPYFQEHKRQLEGSEASGLVASDPSS